MNVFKNVASKIWGMQLYKNVKWYISNFLKATFQKFNLVRSWIIYLKKYFWSVKCSRKKRVFKFTHKKNAKSNWIEQNFSWAWHNTKQIKRLIFTMVPQPEKHDEATRKINLKERTFINVLVFLRKESNLKLQFFVRHRVWTIKHQFYIVK